MVVQAVFARYTYVCINNQRRRRRLATANKPRYKPALIAAQGAKRRKIKGDDANMNRLAAATYAICFVANTSKLLLPQKLSFQ